jgi:hypothetical protein
MKMERDGGSGWERKQLELQLADRGTLTPVNLPDRRSFPPQEPPSNSLKENLNLEADTQDSHVWKETTSAQGKKSKEGKTKWPCSPPTT